MVQITELQPRAEAVGEIRVTNGTTLGRPYILPISIVRVPRLANFDQREFTGLQQFVRKSKNILRVSASGKREMSSEGEEDLLPWDPRYDATTGCLRTIRSKETGKHIVTLAIPLPHENGPRGIAESVTEIFNSPFSSDNPRISSELEYIVQDGIIMIGRLEYENRLDEKCLSFIHQWDQILPRLSAPPLTLAIGQPGMIDSLCYVEDERYSHDLAVDEVEIEALMWPLSLREVFIVLGKIDIGRGLKHESVGTVTRTGSACSEQFRPGDRVIIGVFGSMRSHPRSKSQNMRKLPDHLSFEEAVSPGNSCMTAWKSLVNIARLQKGEKILIHSAAGATGQMAIQVAHLIWATVFATVSSDEKRDIVTELGVSKDHIFNRREISFAQEIKRVTKGLEVGFILNYLASDSLQACRRFIEIGKADIIANSSSPMVMFAKNVTFAAVDLAEIP